MNFSVDFLVDFFARKFTCRTPPRKNSPGNSLDPRSENSPGVNFPNIVAWIFFHETDFRRDFFFTRRTPGVNFSGVFIVLAW